MVYAENCLIDSYARGTYSPLVRLEERGILAIVSFNGPADKRVFNPQSTKVGFPENNIAYARVVEMAAELMAQRITNIPANAPAVGARRGDSNWIQCEICIKWRRVDLDYRTRYDDRHWNCAIQDSPVPFPPGSRCASRAISCCLYRTVPTRSQETSLEEFEWQNFQDLRNFS